MLPADIEAHVKGCGFNLASKTVYHKLHRDLQLLSIPTQRWKNLFIDFVTGLPILTNWKSETNDSILVIIHSLTKMINYKLVIIRIDAPQLAEVIINLMVRLHSLSDSIVSNCSSVFFSKFWSSLCHFLGIKWRLLITFNLQTNKQTEISNSIMKAYLRAFLNEE